MPLMPGVEEELNSFIRNEKNTRSKLKEIPDEFFKRVDSEMRRLKEEIRGAIQKDDVKYIAQLTQKIRSIENGIKELKSIRCRKIALQALEDAIDGSNSGLDAYTNHERILYDNLRRLFKSYINEEEPQTQIKEEKKEEAEEIRRIPVRVIIPMEVADVDGNYVMRKEDVLYLSEQLARLLQSKGVCEIIKIQ
jgi:DNA replication initiation complex subunit (GINS family)